MQDSLIGTWKLNAARSEFDANHRPSAGMMILELTPEGHYVLTAEGVTERGEKCAERPTKLIPDGKVHPVPDLPGLTSVVTRPDPNTLVAEVRREDGSVVGGGAYEVSPDGNSLTATTFGYDTQLRQFQQKTMWNRQ
ncbi:MAG: hypothetical protein KIT09_05465 [Bryobacteraceae bacterium]|nr:hypothetical protein [Bryobacteraceae bacterium]